MKTVRITATILYWLARIGAVLFLTVAIYATAVLLLYTVNPSSELPIQVAEDRFVIFLPFTETSFLLGEYTSAYIATYFITIAFYGIFLWLLGGVFHSFRQKKLFTQKGVSRLSRFYITNLAMPVLFILLVLLFREESADIIRIMLLHLIIGVFAFFMAAIFKQGLVLQEEQDLTF
jgi:hypothetical protein